MAPSGADFSSFVLAPAFWPFSYTSWSRRRVARPGCGRQQVTRGNTPDHRKCSTCSGMIKNGKWHE